MQNKERLNLVLSTLKLITINSKKDNDLEYQLEELEGDSYTFLHKNTLEILLKERKINQEEFNIILSVREKILNVESELWNIKDFLESTKWKDIRTETINLLKLLEKDNSK